MGLEAHAGPMLTRAVKDSASRITARVHVEAYPVQNAPGC